MSVRKFFAVVLIASTFVVHKRLERAFPAPYPPFQKLMILGDQPGLQDLSLIVLGFRSVAADLAWIQLLQYFGGAIFFDFNDSSRDYPLLKSLTLRVMRIDPYFVEAIAFGAVSLAWIRTVNRPQEAIDLLKEGTHYNPTYWPLQSYLVSLGYQSKDQFENMLEVLGETLRDPGCPLHVKAIIANTFKLHHKYREALIIWKDIYQSTLDSGYRDRALQQIQELHQKMPDIS